MPIYTVEIYPQRSYVIDVEAGSVEEARQIAKSNHDDYEEYDEQDWGVEVREIWPKNPEDWD